MESRGVAEVGVDSLVGQITLACLTKPPICIHVSFQMRLLGLYQLVFSSPISISYIIVIAPVLIP